LDPYRRESLKILAIFKEMVPRGEIEKASIDEAFLDLSQLVIERLLEKFPYLGRVPDDAPDGMDSILPDAPSVEWGKAGNVFPGNGEPAPDGAEASGEGEIGEEGDVGNEIGVEQGKDGGSWEDWALCIGGEIMAEVREEVWKRLHYTCSAVSHSRTPYPARLTNIGHRAQ
jgi:DNA polymerase eta